MCRTLLPPAPLPLTSAPASWPGARGRGYSALLPLWGSPARTALFSAGRATHHSFSGSALSTSWADGFSCRCVGGRLAASSLGVPVALPPTSWPQEVSRCCQMSPGWRMLCWAEKHWAPLSSGGFGWSFTPSLLGFSSFSKQFDAPFLLAVYQDEARHWGSWGNLSPPTLQAGNGPVSPRLGGGLP